MPFEPLRTDEKIEGAAPKKERDMDGLMLAGCSGFVLAAVGSYVLAVWPFFLFQDSERLASVGLSCGLGLVPAAVLGAVAARRFGLPGACGFIGGAAATAAFLNLRLNQAFVSALARQAPTPDYPSSLAALLPLAWLLLALLVSASALPKGGSVKSIGRSLGGSPDA